jgi:outer membrane PBP1 activator LpoA protein
VNALTGYLRMGTDSRVHRELEWGRFWRGKVQHAPPRVLLVVEPGLPDS